MRALALYFVLLTLSSVAMSDTSGSSTQGTPPNPGTQIYCDPNTNAAVFAKLKAYEAKIKNAQNDQDRKNQVALHQQAVGQLQCTYVSTQTTSGQ